MYGGSGQHLASISEHREAVRSIASDLMVAIGSAFNWQVPVLRAHVDDAGACVTIPTMRHDCTAARSNAKRMHACATSRWFMRA